jgi:menaquinone-specific isochorismate synthase
LIELLPDDLGPLSWLRGGEGLVGWGEVARFSWVGPDRFAVADDWWRTFSGELDISDEVGLPGTGPVAFASFAFADGPAPSVLVVPRVLVGRRDGRGWITEFDEENRPHRLLRMAPIRPTGALHFADGQLPVHRWRSAVAEAVRRLRSGRLDKVILAHDLMAAGDEPLDPRFVLAGLAERYPTCWSFVVDGLVGATPELLVRRSGDAVRSRVLAGTIWPGQADDEALGATLLASAKDQAEHRLAVESLGAALRPLCDELDVPPAPSVVALANVSHLATDVRGRLADHPAMSLLRLAEVVHPTAAVGGTPREPALELITELETMDRGRYAGPVGWVDAAGDGELGVALRCAQLSGSSARLFAGCGLVAESDPDTEVAEAAAKLVAVRDALAGY